jgi:hypothetical protein
MPEVATKVSCRRADLDPLASRTHDLSSIVSYRIRVKETRSSLPVNGGEE